ncbi:MAG: serine O-acetyltransferase [Pseudomonadota bacterium]|nr:serine O-acetyltransferase [Pseudomonadota bacterium]
MTLASGPSTGEDFSLTSYLAADLRRAHTLVHGGPPGASARFWLGAFSPRFVPVLLCRLAHWFYRLRLAPVAKAVSLLNFFLFGIEIAVRCPIGPGLFLPHTQGTVIGAWRIGANATIFQGVTLGAREIDFSYSEASRPVLGEGVTVGSGAKVLGGLHIGDDARIGANSVVLGPVPAGTLAVGAPARVVRQQPGAPS